MELFGSILGFFWEFAKTWWWLFLPFLLWKPALFLWFQWRNDIFSSKQRYIMLELKMPLTEVLKPIKGMENVFSGLWQTHDPPNPREKWIEGQYQVNFSIEIVSSEGQIHFYMRVVQGARRLVESAIYSQYPEAEITLVEDYTKFFPRDIPNKDWELWGTSYKLEKPDSYPIRTYAAFFEETTAEKEEKRIDPLSLLLEGLAKIGQGEHIWVQIILWPVLPSQDPYVERGKAIIDKLVKRPEKAKPSFMGDMQKAGRFLATGKPAEEEAPKQEFAFPEMMLTPGERKIIEAIEQKISKASFQASIRCAYLARREHYFSPTKALPMSFFTQLSTSTLNNFKPITPTYTKVKTTMTWFLDARRVFLKRRRLYRYYTSRLSPFYPWEGREKAETGKFLLNIEELATIFHFPGKMTVPGMAVPRIESKKGEAPPELPTE